MITQKLNQNVVQKIVGWKRVRLGEVCKLKNGFAFESSNYKSDGIPVIRISDINAGVVETKNSVKVQPKKEYEQFLVESGDILIAMSGATTGKFGIYKSDEKAFQNQRVGRFEIINPSLHKDFLFFQLHSLKREIEKDAYGGAQPNISSKKIEEMEIMLAPTFQQKQIVSKIVELFSELDKSEEQLKTAQRQLKIYRQSVLKWAFGGRLTNDDVNDNAMPEGWEWKKSGDLFYFVTSGSRGWAKYYCDRGAIFIRITNLDFDSLYLDLDPSKVQHVNPPSNSEGIRTKVKEGDFLFSITGYLGMFAIAPKIENAYVNQHIALCRPKDFFDKKFVGYWIISHAGGHLHLNKLTKGATKAGLGLDDIKNFPVPLAPLDEQKRVVQEIESRLSEADKLKETINHSLLQVQVVRQSILKKAFEGKLI